MLAGILSDMAWRERDTERESAIGGGGEEQSPGLIFQGQWRKSAPVTARVATFPRVIHPRHHRTSDKLLTYPYAFIYILWRGLDRFRIESSLGYVCSWPEPFVTSFESEVAQS